MTDDELRILCDIVESSNHHQSNEANLVFAARELLDRVRDRDALAAELARILAITSHVKLGTTTNEVCDKVVRAHDEIVTLREDRDALADELKLWKPLTPEEAEKALDEAKAVPMTKDEIDAIVAKATDPATRLPNNELAQLIASNQKLAADLEAARTENAECRERLAKVATIGDPVVRPVFPICDDEEIADDRS